MLLINKLLKIQAMEDMKKQALSFAQKMLRYKIESITEWVYVGGYPEIITAEGRLAIGFNQHIVVVYDENEAAYAFTIEVSEEPTPKYAIDQKVMIMHRNTILPCEIIGVTVAKSTSGALVIMYTVDGDSESGYDVGDLVVYEKDVYYSKRDLLDALEYKLQEDYSL